MGRVQDKVAIVTGGSTGLGKATAELLAAEGAKVVIADIQDDLGAAAAAEIQASGGWAHYFHMDVTTKPRSSRSAPKSSPSSGSIDILVNNAGITGAPKPTHEITVEEWDKVLNVDAKGVFLCTKHAVPYMQQSGGGSIVNISSVYGIAGAWTCRPPFLYHAAKGAVRVMTKSDAICYAADKIRVNSVHPGWLWTPMLENVGKDSTEGRRRSTPASSAACPWATTASRWTSRTACSTWPAMSPSSSPARSWSSTGAIWPGRPRRLARNKKPRRRRGFFEWAAAGGGRAGPDDLSERPEAAVTAASSAPARVVTAAASAPVSPAPASASTFRLTATRSACSTLGRTFSTWIRQELAAVACDRLICMRLGVRRFTQPPRSSE